MRLLEECIDQSGFAGVDLPDHGEKEGILQVRHQVAQHGDAAWMNTTPLCELGQRVDSSAQSGADFEVIVAQHDDTNHPLWRHRWPVVSGPSGGGLLDPHG